MRIYKFLIINSRGNVTIRERQPRLAGNEIALKLSLEVPDELFTRPVLEAKMSIPKDAVPKATITPQITDNIEQIIKEATGLNMIVSVIEHPQEKEEEI